MARRITEVHACIAILVTSLCLLILRLELKTPPLVVVVPRAGQATPVTQPLPTDVVRRSKEDIGHATLASNFALNRTETFRTSSLIPTRRPDADHSQVEPAAGLSVDQARVGKIMVLYGEQSPTYERALRTHEEHSRLHGYPMFVHRDSIMPGYWTKPAYIQSMVLQELSKPESQRLSWLFWFDADTIVLNYKMPLETFLPPNDDKDLSDVKIIVSEDWNGLNNGIFAIRIAPDSVKLLAAILAFRDFRPETMLLHQDQTAMSIILQQRKFSEIAVTVPQRWFNSYATFEEEKNSDAMVQRGDFLVHFAGIPQREKLMDEWCEQSERHDPQWVLDPKDTIYPAEVEWFWENLKVELAARNDADRFWEERKSHLQLMGRYAARAFMKLSEETKALQLSISASDKLFQRIKSLGGTEVKQEDRQELDSTISEIEQLLKNAAA